MNDHQLVNARLAQARLVNVRLVEALRAGEPGAVANLFDAYGERLFQFCWFMLGNRDTAQIATRDTFVAAEAHVAGLRDPGALRLWLYALARVECQRQERESPQGAASGRRRESPQRSSSGRRESPQRFSSGRRESAPDPDEPVARPDQRDASARLMAWHAVMGLQAAEREALDLAARHGLRPPELALVLGSTQTEVQELLTAARGHLQQALGAELLASKGSHDCAGRTELMRGWAGTLTPQLRARIMTHAATCEVCGRKIPRSVRDSRVYSLLPVPVSGPGLREQVLSCFSDSRQAGSRAIAAGRAAAFGASGFPLATAGPSRKGVAWRGRRGRPGSRLWAGLAAATAAGAVAMAFAFLWFGGPAGLRTSGGAAGSPIPSAGSRPQLRPSPTATPVGAGGRVQPAGPAQAQAPSAPAGAPVAANHGPAIPAGSAGTRLFVVPRPVQPGGPMVPAPGPTPAAQVTVTPSSLDLGARSQGSVTITAVGGPASWSASADSADLTVSESSGTLAPGQSYTLAVTVSRSGRAGGSGVIDIYPGHIQVQVSWAPAPASGSYPPAYPPSAPGPSRPPHRHRRPVPDPPQPSAPSPSAPAPSAPAPSAPAPTAPTPSSPASPAPSPGPAPSSGSPSPAPSTGSSTGSSTGPAPSAASSPASGEGRRRGDVTRR